MTQAFMVRQPIYNHRQQVIAYDLVFRDAHQSSAEQDRLIQRVRDLGGLAAVVGNRFAFLQLDSQRLQTPEAFPFPSSKAMIWVPDDKVLPQNLELIQSFADHGYQVAVDLDSVDRLPDELLHALSMVRVDVHRHSLDGLAERLYPLPGYGLKLLATNVDTRTVYEGASQAGCRFFHGSFFFRPEVVQGRRMPAGRLTVLRLLSQLQAPDTDLNELEEIISHDVSLSYRLLRHLNSAYFGLLRKVESIRHAVVYLGMKNLRVWASVILMTKIEGKPIELMKTSLVRGRMCELLAAEVSGEDTDHFFTVGLLSTLDVLLDCPMDEVLEELPVSFEIQQALKEREGSAGKALQCVIDYENAKWGLVDGAPFKSEAVVEAYLQAIKWGEETLGLLTAD